MFFNFVNLLQLSYSPHLLHEVYWSTPLTFTLQGCQCWRVCTYFCNSVVTAEHVTLRYLQFLSFACISIIKCRVLTLQVSAQHKISRLQRYHNGTFQVVNRHFVVCKCDECFWSTSCSKSNIQSPTFILKENTVSKTSTPFCSNRGPYKHGKLPDVN